MPNIRDYSARVESQGTGQSRKATGEEFGAGVGQAVSGLGGAVTDVGEAINRRQAQEETSRAAVEFSKLHAQKTQEFDDAVQQGTLKTEEFMNKFDEAVGKMSGDYSTRSAQQYFNQTAAEMRGHFLKSSFAGQAELASIKAGADLKDTLSNYSSALISDPSGYEMSKTNFESFIADTVSTGHLPFAEGEKLKAAGRNQLAQAAVRGQIEISPQGAKAQLHEGLWNSDLDGKEIITLQREAETAIGFQREEAERRKKLEKDAIKAEQKQIADGFLTKLEAGTLSSKEVLRSKLDPFGEDGKETFLRLMKAHREGKLEKNSAVFNMLFKRIHLPDGDPNKITEDSALNPYVGKGLDVEWLSSLRGEIAGKGTQEGREESEAWRRLDAIVTAALVKKDAYGQADKDGEAAKAQFLDKARKTVREGRAQGKSIDSMLSPNSKDYVGQNLPVKSFQEKIRNNYNMNRPKPKNPEAVRKSGESAQDFLKRQKGNN